MEYEKIKTVILHVLKENLPEHLSYHSVLHVKDVIKAAEERMDQYQSTNTAPQHLSAIILCTNIYQYQ